MALLLFLVWLSLAVAAEEGALTIPFVFAGDLATPDQLHQALLPAWDSLVDGRNNAGLVAPKEEGKPQPPLSKEETAFQFNRVQKGEVDSARLLLVFGMVPSVSHMDNETVELLLSEQRKAAGEDGNNTGDSGDGSSHLPAVVDPDLRYPDGSTPLHMAATFGLVESVRGFLDAGADVHAVARSGVRPIHVAAIMGHAGVVEVLAERRADIDARHTFAGSTPLHFATEMGHPQVVRRLCELGADVEANKKQGGTAIHISADTNNAAVTRALIEEPCGADPDAVLLGDTVPLYLAAGRGFHEVIDVLIEAGANPDRTLWPERPWKKKKKKQKRDMVKKKDSEQGALQLVGDPQHLLPGSHPGAPGWEEGNGATALHNACENGHLRAVIALLDGGARQLASMEGVTPLIIALQYRHPEIASALLDHKTAANVAVANPKDGQTALHIAAAYDYPEVVARILRVGGSLDVRDRRGILPVEYSRGKLVQFVLGRFQGRNAQLDAIVRAHNREEDLPQRLLNAKGAAPDVAKLYADYAQRHADGTLEDEAAKLAQMITRDKQAKDDDSKSALRRFAIVRFLLAGGDAPIAVEAMMQKTKAAMHVGLVLLGVRVASIDYKPGKLLKVNGYDVLERVQQAIRAALDSSQKGDAGDFESMVAELRDVTEGRGRSRVESGEEAPARNTAKVADSSEEEEENVLEL